MDNTKKDKLRYYLDLLKECRRENINPTAEVISDIQSDGFDVNQLWKAAGRLVFIEAMEDTVRAVLKKANIKSPADIQTLKGNFSFINKDHLTNEEVDAIFDKVLKEYAQEYDTYVEELVHGKRSPDEAYFQRLINILNISKEEAENEIAEKKASAQKQKEEERISRIKPILPKNKLRIKLAQVEAPGQNNERPDVISKKQETSPAKDCKTDNSNEDPGFVYVMSAFSFMAIVGLVLFCVIAYKCGYGFWGWVGMVYGGLNAGGIIGLIIGYILKNILKKGKK